MDTSPPEHLFESFMHRVSLILLRASDRPELLHSLLFSRVVALRLVMA